MEVPIEKGVYTLIPSGSSVRRLYSQPPASTVAISCLMRVTSDL